MVYFAKWKVILIAVLCAMGIAFAFPNLLNEEQTEVLPSWLPNQKLSLGLDLQGGSHLLFEVDVTSVLKERQQGLVDALRLALRSASPRIGYRELGMRGECVGFRALRQEDVSRAEKIARKLDTNTFTPALSVEEDEL